MNNDPLIIKLNNVRLSFPSLHEKQAVNDGKPAWKAAFLLHKKKNAADIAAIQAAIKLLTKEEFAGKALPPDRLCLKEANLKEYDGYDSDHMVVAASNSKTKPGIVDNELNVISQGDAADPYPGCYVNATIRLWAMNGKTNKMEKSWGQRIPATLRNVQVLLRGGKPYGEAFGERQPSAEDEFSKVEETADEAGV